MALKATFYSEKNIILEQKIEDLCENLDRKPECFREYNSGKISAKKKE